MSSLKTTPLDGTWEFLAKSWPTPPARLAYSRMEWLPATVPGHVHRDLIDNQVIADPFSGLQELGCQWVDETDWIYRRRFTFTPDPALPRRILRFEGLDTVCKVFLDAELLAEHDNMFVPLELDLSDRLSPGEHELRVEFTSAARVGRARRERYFAEQALPEHTVRFAERAFVRKAQFMFGWDWGPRLCSAGIWRPVRLLEHAGRIRDVLVQQVHEGDGSVTLSFASELELASGSAHALHFVEGFDAPLRDGEELRIAEPRLWWPAGLGERALYRVTSVLVPSGTSNERARQAALHTVEQRVGLRTIELVQAADEHGRSFEFKVNGRALWAVGANWIPDHSFVGVIDRARLEQQLRRAVDLEMNMLRVWGGGLYETDEFYDLCDELGLLVWQDFPFACSYYPDGPEMQRVIAREAAVNVKRLRNRASLALWCGNNENHQMFDMGWEGRENNPPRFYGEQLYHQTLPEVLAALDPGRPYVASSPIGGEHPNDGGIGDQHYWDVWHGRGDWQHYRDSTARFSSEFGFASSPGPATWEQVSPGALALAPDHAVARWHDKTLKGTDTFLAYVELHYPKAESIAHWAYTSQLNQRDALRFGIEHYRRSDFCKGSLVWQLNDCWPVQSWAVIDFAGDYKAAAYELRRLYAPILVSLAIETDERGARTAEVWLVSDNTQTVVKGQLVLEAHDLLSGKCLGRWERACELAPGTRVRQLTQDLSQLDPTRSLLSARFAERETHRLLAEPKDASFAAVELRARWNSGVIELDASGPLVDLLLWDPSGQTKLLDNLVTLPSGGRAPLRANGPKPLRLIGRSLAGPVELSLSE